MKIIYCDICNLPIKIGSNKYLLGINKVVEESTDNNRDRYKDVYAEIQKFNQNVNNVKVYEICETCKKIVDHVLKMRREECAKILKEIEASANAKKEDGNHA